MGKYKMSIDYNVLNHLGINLYSSIPAVLSEVVANSYDADATEVNILIEDDTVIIEDNGCGMTELEINEKYLLVGYQKRVGPNGMKETPKFKRKVMGRKGIGKLSLMSIAKIIEVHTCKNGVISALRIKVDDIVKLINEGSKEPYEPEEIESTDELFVGTKIILKDIRNNRTLSNPEKIKTELARRFIVLNNEFRIKVNESEITFLDRKYFDKVIKLFKYGDCGIEIDPQLSMFDDNLKIIERSYNFNGSSGNSYSIKGWIGYVEKSDELKEGLNSLNRISILTNGKMGQEDILQEVHNTSMFTNYIIGEIEAPFLDGDNDLSTSNREGYKKDSIEYDELLSFLKTEISHLGADWNKYKQDQGVKAAVSVEPKIKKWFDALEGDEKKYAKTLLGKVNSMITNEAQRKDFTKYSILAFEKMKLKKSLSAIENFNEKTIEALPMIFQGVNDLEESMYYQIVHQRIEIIKKFENITREDQKEKVLQEYLYKNLWLLDPSWERPTSSEDIEISLKRLFDKEVGLTREEKASRLDIRFKNFAGKTVIVELKRYGRTVKIGEIVGQISKYRDGISKILRAQKPKESPNFEIIILLGNHIDGDPSIEKYEMVAKTLKPYDARVVYYDELISNAMNAYSSYFEQKDKINPILDIFESIDADV